MAEPADWLEESTKGMELEIMAERLVIWEGEVRVRDEELAYAEEELRTLREDKERLTTERDRALEGGRIVARRIDAIARLKQYESIPGPDEAFRDPGPWVRWADMEPILTPPAIAAVREKNADAR